MLKIQNLITSIEDKEILKGVDLTVKPGEIHAIMGPNGSGKTSLAMSIAGHPSYVLDKKISKIFLNKKNITDFTPDERAKAGLFVSFQNPVEITGVSLLAFLRTATKNEKQKIPLSEFKKNLSDALKKVNLSEDFMQRYVNVGLSGGEKKRSEIVQMLVLKPKFAILDEIDSGLDIDSLKLVSETVQDYVKKYNCGVIIITHYQRILSYLKPSKIHVLKDGIIKKTGNLNLVKKIEKEGYAAI